MEDKKLQIFVARLKGEFGKGLKKIVLFGSRARGDSSIESDYDLLLVFDRITKETEEVILDIEGEMLYKFNLVFSAFPIAEKDMEEREFSPFLMNIQREGVSV